MLKDESERGARALRTDETRQRVLSAARTLFRGHGFEGTTTELIAARAGVAKGTVFLHARSKERLLLLVYAADLEFAVERALASMDVTAPLPHALAGAFGFLFRLFEEDEMLARRFVKEQAVLADDDDPSARALQRFLSGIAQAVDARQRRGEVAEEVDTALAARASYALYGATLAAWLAGGHPDRASRDRELVAALGLLWTGLTRGGGRSR